MLNLIKPENKGIKENIGRLRKAIDDADAIIIGAGAGLSTSAGYIYTGERFEKYFADFKETVLICTAWLFVTNNGI